MSSDDALMICKRFGYIFSRLLSHKQAEVSQLEARMIALDKLDQDCTGDQDLESQDHCAGPSKGKQVLNRRSSTSSEKLDMSLKIMQELEKITLEYCK